MTRTCAEFQTVMQLSTIWSSLKGLLLKNLQTKKFEFWQTTFLHSDVLNKDAEANLSDAATAVLANITQGGPQWYETA